MFPRFTALLSIVQRLKRDYARLQARRSRRDEELEEEDIAVMDAYEFSVQRVRDLCPDALTALYQDIGEVLGVDMQVVLRHFEQWECAKGKRRRNTGEVDAPLVKRKDGVVTIEFDLQDWLACKRREATEHQCNGANSPTQAVSERVWDE